MPKFSTASTGCDITCEVAMVLAPQTAAVHAALATAPRERSSYLRTPCARLTSTPSLLFRCSLFIYLGGGSPLGGGPARPPARRASAWDGNGAHVDPELHLV
eukprot:9091343-Pyramimonas_sp.AAC.1